MDVSRGTGTALLKDTHFKRVFVSLLTESLQRSYSAKQRRRRLVDQWLLCSPPELAIAMLMLNKVLCRISSIQIRPWLENGRVHGKRQSGWEESSCPVESEDLHRHGNIMQERWWCQEWQEIEDLVCQLQGKHSLVLFQLQAMDTHNAIQRCG